MPAKLQGSISLAKMLMHGVVILNSHVISGTASAIVITCVLPLVDIVVAPVPLAGTDAAMYLPHADVIALSMESTMVILLAVGAPIRVVDEATTTVNAVLLDVDAVLLLLHARTPHFLHRVLNSLNGTTPLAKEISKFLAVPSSSVA
jgi:hypothetical protein